MAEKLNVLLGVTGSVAAYRAADLARVLMRAGADVRVCLTRSASQFVTPQLFEALTGNSCLIDVFEEPIPGRMAHIDWARWAHVFVVAPATATTLAKLAHGIGDNMLTTIGLATTAPWVLAPAMNPQMYASDPATAAMELLARRGAFLVEPSEGDVACGEHGQGKLADIATIAGQVLTVSKTRKLFGGKKVLITSGPTQEPIDSVRYLTNRSSGKMGSALAMAALLMGAEVTVIAGPSSARYPLAANIRPVRTALEMLEAARQEAASADLIIAAAAVADFRSAETSSTKIRKEDQPLCLPLIENPDIVATLAREFPRAKVVAFAAEPSENLEAAKEKRVRKNLAAIAVNDVSNPAIGFESDHNELALVTSEGSVEHSGRRSKLACAIWLLEQLAD